MNVDQMYSCLLKLNLNFCIGPSSNYKHKTYIFQGQKRGLSNKYVKNDIFGLLQFSSNVLLHQHFELNFLKSLFDTMLKRYQKKKRKYLHCQMHLGGGGVQNRKK